ncbi:MAG: ATP-binding protein [Crocinitomicaceae bacterium]|nr:ATP-binding protein [Crocinitomicaceae bacterium]
MREGFTVIDELAIPSTFDSIHEVESLIDTVCTKMDVSESFGNILIAVTEAVNNAIIHGNKNNLSKQVYIKSADNNDSFCFVVEDEGNGFDFNSLPDPTAPENLEKENGRGIFLMRNLSDEVEFSNNGSSVSIFFSK